MCTIQVAIHTVLLSVVFSITAELVKSPVLAEEITPSSRLEQIRMQLLDTEQAPLDLNPQEEINRNLAITQDTISTTALTSPSLWWSRDQITAAVGNLRIAAWVAYRGSEGQPRRVDVVINPQIWNLLNYLERYAVLNQFGSVAKSYGYSTRIFRGRVLTGAYICDFNGQPDLETEMAATYSTESLATIDCMIDLDYRERGSIRGNPRPDGF